MFNNMYPGFESYNSVNFPSPNFMPNFNMNNNDSKCKKIQELENKVNNLENRVSKIESNMYPKAVEYSNSLNIM